MRQALFAAALLAVALAQGDLAGLIAQGRFAEAYERGVREATPQALVLAAQAASYHAMYVAQPEEKRAWFERAEKAASQAIAQDPGLAEAHFERARALGRLSQFKGILEALAEGLALPARTAADRYEKERAQKALAELR